MKNIFLISLIALITGSACHNAGPKEESANKDSISTNENIAVQKLSGLFKSELQLPFTVDSAFLARGNFGDSLGTGELELLGKNWFKHELVSGMDYGIKEFYKIDSVKATGTYSQWSEKLDIGMNKYANAYSIGKIKLSGDVTLLVWAFKLSSYEACPWSSETSVFFTIVNHSVIGESFMLGESFGAGDAPVWMSRDVYGTLNADGILNMNWREENDDADGTESEVEERKYSFMIKDGNVQMIKEEKGKSYKVPHPKEAQ